MNMRTFTLFGIGQSAIPICLGALLGSCGSAHSGDCAPIGTYTGSMARSADPGDCPTTEDFQFTADDVTVKDNTACGSETMQDSGNSGSCSFQGTHTLTASQSGIVGHGTFIFQNCSGVSKCTANYDMAYTLVGPTGTGGRGSGTSTAATGGTVGTTGTTGPVGSADAGSTVLLGKSCVPNCTFSCAYARSGDVAFEVETMGNCTRDVFCISNAERGGYLSICCASDADCATPLAIMRCLPACGGSFLAGRCMTEADYGAVISSTSECASGGTASGGVGGTAGVGGAGGTGGAGGATKVCSATSTAGCKAQMPEGCGDGINNQNGIEECDDGNALPGDGCNGACRVEPNWRCPPAGACTREIVCGDSIISAGEVCDDGNNFNNDGCNSTCTVQDPAYKCIAGQPCTRSSQCGNKRIEPGEQCDDGNSQSGDGCSSNCHLEAGWVCRVPGEACQQASHGCLPNCPPGDYCGNGIVNGTEACDDGINDGTYGTCNPDCTLAPRCGDGVVQSDYGEECEPTMSSDPNCTNVCRKPDGCGDGKIEPPEQCDDGALFNNGGYGACAPSCIYAPHCGDGVKNGPEECDDGINDAWYGGCTPQCKLAPHCGDGIVNGPEECDDGAQNGLDGLCTAWCKDIHSLP